MIIPYDAIERLVRYVIAATEEDWRDKGERFGPIANENHILNSATEVLYWLDALEMTRWSQDTIDALKWGVVDGPWPRAS